MKDESTLFFLEVGLLLVALGEGSATGCVQHLMCCVQQFLSVLLCSGTLSSLLVLPEQEGKKNPTK